jgi:5-methylcytosine-specific restriction endonuclease McrA
VTRLEHNARRGRSSKWITRERRHAIYRRDGYRCVWCGSTDQPLSLDHAIPRARGGTHRSDNLITACKRCNDSRKDCSLAEFARRVAGSKWRQLLGRVSAARRRRVLG